MTSTFFNGRSITKAEDLKGPRVYSTDLITSLFDPDRLDECRLASARSLKIKIITKGVVTINCRHLVAPLGFHLFRQHPDLLQGEAILPAFREDRSSLADYVVEADFSRAGIGSAEVSEHLAALDSGIKRVMPWQLANVGESLRNLLLNGLLDERSLISRELKERGRSTQQIEQIARGFEGLNYSEERPLEEYLATIAADVQSLVRRFAAACYHINGTSVVRCETGTDLSPLSSFKAADVLLAARDARDDLLSEDAIFLEAFMGFALDTIHAAVLPAQVIDAMDFKTAHELSRALREQGFQTKYDEIISSLASSITHPDPSEALDSLDEGAIAGKAAELASAFRTEIEAELPNYKTAIQSEAAEEAYRAGTDVGIDIATEAAKMLPVIGAVVSFAGIIQSSAAASTAGGELWSVRKQKDAFEQAQRKRADAIKAAVARLKAGQQKKAKLLDAAAALSDVHGLLIRRA